MSLAIGYLAPISLAQEGGQGGNALGALLPFIVLIGVFYLLILRPQQRRQRDQRALLDAVKQGDRVVAAGGIVGTVRRVDEETISLQVAENVVIKVDRGSVAKRLTA